MSAALSLDVLAVTVAFLDGREFAFAPRSSDTVAALKRRFASTALGESAAAATVRLCLNGELLADGAALSAVLPAGGATLTAWTMRYSRHRSDEARALTEARQKRREHSGALYALRRDGPAVGAALLAAARAVSVRWWAVALVWLLAALLLRAAEMLPLLGFVTAIALIWHNLGERQAGTTSAYTVFNEGMRALPGQLKAEDIERDMTGAARM